MHKYVIFMKPHIGFTSPSVFSAFLLAFTSVSMLSPLQSQELDGWDLIWADEFELPNGSSPDPAYWNYNIGTGNNGWGNAELQYYTNRTENVRIEEGELVIQVREESFGGSNYTSGRLLTQNKLDWRYGRVEARIKVPAGTGIWPAFWMLGSNINEVSWPQCGEIDIMEFVGRVPNEIFGTIHGPGYSGGNAYGNIVNFGEPVPNRYHTYRVEWEPNLISWYVDDMLYHTATPEDVAPNQWVFEAEQFIILNVAVGGNFGGALGSDLVFPVQMNVDYVRVYQLEGGYDIPVVSNDIPGRVEAEDYNNTFGFRTEVTTDVGGGINVGYLTDGDWAEYVLNVPSSGTYALDIRYASPTGTAGVTITTDTGIDMSFSDFPATGDWQNWETASAGEITLPAGEVTLRVTIDLPGDDDINLNWMEFSFVGNQGDSWAGYPVDENGFADTGSFLGFVYVGGGPWVWVMSINSWMYLPEQNIQPSGSWGYLAN